MNSSTDSACSLRKPSSAGRKHAPPAYRPQNAAWVKGFGNFRNNEGLTQEQIELITRCVDGEPGGGTTHECCRSLRKHPFLLRRPIHLPAGTIIRGVPADAVIALIPVK